MKTTRSNSFRLHRITRTSSMKRDNDNTTLNGIDAPFKLDAINSINKGVKYNDLSYITGRELNKLRKQPTSQTDIAFESAQLNLGDMRKKYDDIKKKCTSLQQSLFNLKEEKQRYQLKQNDFNGGKNQGKEKVENLEKLLDQRRLLLEAIETERQVLKSLTSRHKTDKVFYDQQKYNLEQEYSHLRKQMKIFSKEGTEIGQNTDRTGKVYEKFIRQLQAQRKERQNHLESIQKLLSTKASVLESNEVREMEIQQIAERAMLDKNQNQKQWEKIFLTHTFLSKMLRNKIEREMEKFTIVEFAFKEIKTATGVNNAQLLVQKYLKKEEVYGELLGKISENEKKIHLLKHETELLLAEEKNLESEKQILQNTKISMQDLHDELKELLFMQERSQMTELSRGKYLSWLERQFKKFELFEQKCTLPKRNKNTLTLFRRFSQHLMESFSQLANTQLQAALVQKDVYGSENNALRVVPKTSRKNTKGEQIFYADEEETNATNLAEQNDILALRRQEVIRNNEKFMKDLKKKREEMKKVLIDAMEREKRQKEKPKIEMKKDD